MLVSDHYARMMLAEISPLNPRYHPNESPKLKTQHFVIVIVVRMTAKPDGPGSDSVEEENEIEKQSGRPIQRQIPQRGKAKTVHV